MKNLIRTLTAIMILIAVPIAIFAFFPKLAAWANEQTWAPTLYMLFAVIGALALFIGLDLLNRVEVFKNYMATADNEKEAFWEHKFHHQRLGFLKYGLGALLILAVLMVVLVFNLVILPKAPDAGWYMWSLKIMGACIGIGVLVLLNAIMFLDNGKKVILGIDEPSGERAAKKQLSWQDKLFQLKPSFMDAEVDLKEDFDGITELDNPPPPWFMWLFYSTIIFAAVYLVRFTWLEYGPSQKAEYEANFAVYEAGKKKTSAGKADNIDENNVTLETDKAKLADAAALFKSKCATCHGQDGGGMAGSGPNLADEYWIHGNSIKQVFKTIKYGVLSAGMVPWDGQIQPAKMRAVASYVLSLQGTKPANPQPPKGEKMAPAEKF